MLINAIDPEESRIAVVEDGVLQELHVELANREAYLGNIYKGKVVNIEPSIGAAFVAFGGRVNGFLHVSDVLPAYGRPEFLLALVQPLRERARAVVAQAPHIGHGEQEQVQRRGARIAPVDEAPPHQRLVNPAELLGHAAQPLGPQHLLDWLHGHPRGSHRCPVVRGAAWPRQCPLVTSPRTDARSAPPALAMGRSRDLVTPAREGSRGRHHE